MATATRPCSFCGRPSWFGPFEAVFVCEACPRRIGEVLRLEPRSVWSIRTLGEPPAASGGEARRAAARNADVDETFRRFEEGVAAAVAPDDAGTHADLAVAYREMGLDDDALREAGVALEKGRDPHTLRRALKLLLTPPLITPGGLAKLRRRLKV